MKIIFIEPINVLNSKAYRRKLLELNNFNNYDNFIEREFESSKIILLKKILEESGAKMVIYSKDRCCSQKIGAIMHKLVLMGLPDSYWFDTIPSGGESYEALLKWISEKKYIKITNYAIIDSLRNNQTPESAKNVFWADIDNGLTDKIAYEVIDFLNK